VWHEVKPWGYLSAYPTSGLTIAHQIGEELPELFQEIFSFFGQTEAIAKELAVKSGSDKKTKKKAKKTKGKREDSPFSTRQGLNMIWAYKYDNTPLDEVLEDVDVDDENFELTRPQRLVISDEVAPKDWDIRSGCPTSSTFSSTSMCELSTPQ
jgi:hypothetical protein